MHNKKILNCSCYTTILISLIVVATCILYNANWILGDDWQIVATTGVDKFGLQGQHSEGRYWPLGLCDYNLLVFIKGGSTPFGHYLYNVFIMILFFVSMFYLIKEIVKDNQKSLYYISFLIPILLITKDFIRIHIDVIYPERMMIFILSIFMLFYLKALNSNKPSYYLIAFFSACYLTYCKEPIFGVLLVISFVNLLFKYKKITRYEMLFYVALIINSVVYVLQWYFLIFKRTNEFYNLIYTSHLSVLELIQKIILDKPILLLISGIGFVRAYQIIFKKSYDHLFYDSLLFAAIAYVVSFIILNLIHSYYFLISIVLAVPSFIYWIDRGFYFNKPRFFIALIALLSIYRIDLTIELIKNIHALRRSDMKIINELAHLQNSGKKIVFYKDQKDFASEWYYNISNSFLKYCTKIDVDIPVVTNLEKIQSDSAVLYPPFKKRVEKVDFSKISFQQIMNTTIGEVYVKMK